MSGATDAAGYRRSRPPLTMYRGSRHVGREELTVGADVGVGQHARMAVERQAGGPRRRRPHREEVGAGAAVGDAGERDARFVDVVAPLQPVHQRQDVVDLIVLPPLGLGPGARVQHDFVAAGDPVGERTRRLAALGRRRAPDAAVEHHAERPSPGRRVVGGHLGHVVEAMSAHRRRQLDAAGALARIARGLPSDATGRRRTRRPTR